MATRLEYESKARQLNWAGLRLLWQQIKARDTPDWSPGKAFEYLVLRAFELDGAEVRWPYQVPLPGANTPVEEIDGSVSVVGLYSLIESKDESGDVAIAPIAKMRNQLLRRPAGTLGMVFSSHGYTEPALFLDQFALPQAILLWSGPEFEFALNHERLGELCLRKYRACVDSGIVDLDIIEETEELVP